VYEFNMLLKELLS